MTVTLGVVSVLGIAVAMLVGMYVTKRGHLKLALNLIEQLSENVRDWMERAGEAENRASEYLKRVHELEARCSALEAQHAEDQKAVEAANGKS